ncbi:MAG: DUF1272 domain-containing protein [Woeseiaceae bacterium]|nr:DUF1272 domain-containing protein [Woeseiaceae bacterium]
MLQLRPNCELCDKDLAADSRYVMICTFECTFCHDCVNDPLAGVCPNCGGNFELHPTRPAHFMQKHPPSTKRVSSSNGSSNSS